MPWVSFALPATGRSGGHSIPGNGTPGRAQPPAGERDRLVIVQRVLGHHTRNKLIGVQEKLVAVDAGYRLPLWLVNSHFLTALTSAFDNKVAVLSSDESIVSVTDPNLPTSASASLPLRASRSKNALPFQILASDLRLDKPLVHPPSLKKFLGLNTSLARPYRRACSP